MLVGALDLHGGDLLRPGDGEHVRELGRDLLGKLKSGEYRLYSRKVNPKTGRRRNLGTFSSRKAAEQHEREVQYFKRH